MGIKQKGITMKGTVTKITCVVTGFSKCFLSEKFRLNSVAGACLARELIQQASEKRNRIFKGVQGYTGIYKVNRGTQGYTGTYMLFHLVFVGKMISTRIIIFGILSRRLPFPLLKSRHA